MRYLAVLILALVLIWVGLIPLFRTLTIEQPSNHTPKNTSRRKTWAVVRSLVLTFLLLFVITFPNWTDGAPWQYNVGQWYEYGLVTKYDPVKAMQWYRKAAKQGFPPAQQKIGSLYEYVHGTKEDYVEAMKWYRLAADQGDAVAQMDVGLMYLFGRGVKRDLVEADFWLSLANKFGVDFRKKVLFENSQGGDIEKNLTSEQIAEVKRRVLAWKSTPAPPAENKL